MGRNALLVQAEYDHYPQQWLEGVLSLLVQIDPKIKPNPIRITNNQFAQQFQVISPDAKQLLALIETHELSEVQLQKLNIGYLWLNFCAEIYEAFISDPAKMAEQSDFVALLSGLVEESQNNEVDHFLNCIWNQLMPGTKMSYAQCYAILCQTIGPNTKTTRGFLQEIAGDLTEKVMPAVNYAYLMSHYPAQMEAFLHSSAIAHYYQKYWYDKGHDPEKLRNRLYSVFQRG